MGGITWIVYDIIVILKSVIESYTSKVYIKGIKYCMIALFQIKKILIYIN